MSSPADAMYSMGFSKSYQVSTFSQNYLCYPFYDKLNEVSKKSSIVRWVSPIIGITDGIGKLIVITGSIFEAAIKGIANLAVGALFLDARLLKRGSLQLFFIIPARALSILIHIPTTLLLTKGLMFDPEKSTNEAAEWYRSGVAFI